MSRHEAEQLEMPALAVEVKQPEPDIGKIFLEMDPVADSLKEVGDNLDLINQLIDTTDESLRVFTQAPFPHVAYNRVKLIAEAEKKLHRVRVVFYRQAGEFLQKKKERK